MRPMNSRTASRIGSASAGRSIARSRRMPSLTESVTCRAAASASTMAPMAVARLTYRWASCSQVKPIPPCTCVFRFAFWSAAARASVAAMAAV